MKDDGQSVRETRSTQTASGTHADASHAAAPPPPTHSAAAERAAGAGRRGAASPHASEAVAVGHEIGEAAGGVVHGVENLIGALLGHHPPPSQAPPELAHAQSPFVQQVAQHWRDFGGEHNGTISQSQIDQLMKDPGYHGDAAAAIAALDTTSNGKGVTLQQLQQLDRQYQQKGQDKADNTYSWYQGRAASQSHRLFANGTPDYNAIQQGSLGDCYFLSAVAGQARDHPGSIVHMIHDNGNGSYTVHFPGQARPVTVTAPTDAEMARYGNAGADGMWASVLEKAYGQSRSPSGATDPYAAIGHGGNTEGIQTMTGDNTASVSVKTGGSDWWNPFSWGSSPQADPNRTRSILEGALHQGDVVTAYTGSSVDGVPGDHMLTIEGYDPRSNTVTIRNPWGYEPDSRQVRQMGAGQFTMSLAQFDQTFVGIDYEEG